MGLLDDAIRDHIELKRRHGANPGEVARIEHEALGPARREPLAAAPYDEDELDAPSPVTGESGAVVAPDEPPTAPDEPPTAPEPVADAPVPEVAEPPAEPLEPPAEAPASPSEERASGPFDFEADPGEGHEDVLEETPEFLQETPEHDRLWFEQKPPKDFDF
jgi:hypothetical protein